MFCSSCLLCTPSMITILLGDSFIPQFSDSDIYANIPNDYNNITRSLRLYDRLKVKYNIVLIGLNRNCSVKQRSMEDH